MFEGILTCIDRKIQIYPYIKKGAYNTRATRSIEAENLFGEFQDLDPKGTGVLRPDDIPKAISNACELMKARLDPNRNHAFDLPERGERTSYKRKRETINGPAMTARGARPVRHHHKCDESKILPHIRMGIDISDD